MLLILPAILAVDVNLKPGKTHDCLSQESAEKVLGQHAVNDGSTSTVKDGVKRYDCTFTAEAADPKNGRLGHLYYTLEEFSDVASAHNVYDNIVTGNARNPGHSLLRDTGDEAWYHSDGENFSLIVMRKNKNLVRVKVNKLTSFTSQEALKETMRQLADELQ